MSFRSLFRDLIVMIITIYFLLMTVQPSLCKPSKPNASGQSSLAYSQDQKGNYQFAYEITDKGGASNFRQENRDGKVVSGSYGLTDVDGRTRLVNYRADKLGFVAAIDTNEPGTSREDASNAIYNGPDKGKGWAYAVSLQDQSKPNKSDKKNGGSYSGQSESDDDRYSSNEEELYAKEDYASSSSGTTSGNPRVKVQTISSPSSSSSSLSTSPSPINSAMDLPLVGPALHSSSGMGGSSLENGSIQSNVDQEMEGGNGGGSGGGGGGGGASGGAMNEGLVNDFPDEKPTSGGQYTDNDRTLLDDDVHSDDSVQTNEYDYKKREFSSHRPSPVTSSSYSQTVQRLAREQIYPSKSIYSTKSFPVIKSPPRSSSPATLHRHAHSIHSMSSPSAASRSSSSIPNYGYTSRHVPVIRPPKPDLRSVFFWK